MNTLGQGNTNPANPVFPGASGYVSVQGSLMTAIPEIHMSDPAKARALASALTALYGKPVTLKPDPNYPNVQPSSGPKYALAVLIPDVGLLNAGELIAQQVTEPGKIGAWFLDPNLPANAGPQWSQTDAPVPAPTPGIDPGTPGAPPQLGGASSPTANPNVQPIVEALNALTAEVRAALAKLPQ